MIMRRSWNILPFLAPSLLFFSLFTVWPLIKVVDLSIHETNFITTAYVGFDNYLATFRDPAFRQAMLNSAFYMALLVPGNTLGALLLSLWAFRLSKRWQDMARIVLYVPSLAAGMIISQLWAWVFHMEGPINWLIGRFGIPAISWLSKGYTAIPVIAFVIIFGGFGTNFVIFMSSILSIDRSIFDAAKIDGANSRRIDWRIIVPLILPSVYLVALLSAIQGPSIIYNIYAMAPQNYAASIAFHIYQQGFIFSKYGMASAQAVILLMLMICVSLVKKRIAR
jgi:multiple sugar transport system permease protein